MRVPFIQAQCQEPSGVSRRLDGYSRGAGLVLFSSIVLSRVQVCPEGPWEWLSAAQQFEEPARVVPLSGRGTVVVIPLQTASGKCAHSSGSGSHRCMTPSLGHLLTSS